MRDIRDIPFMQVWFARGIVPAVRLLHAAQLLDVAKEHLDVLHLATELMLHREGCGDRIDPFLKMVNEHGWLPQLNMVAERALIDNEAMLSTNQEEAMEAHARNCKNPDCEVKQALKAAGKVAVEALGLHQKRTADDDR